MAVHFVISSEMNVCPCHYTSLPAITIVSALDLGLGYCNKCILCVKVKVTQLCLTLRDHEL